LRTLRLIGGDLKFIRKYGILYVYVVFTALYLLLLAAIPGTARGITATILIYTDPAAMGLFFMGAFIMLERSQRVNCALAVAPITIDQYIISKVVSLLVPGMIVGGILSGFSCFDKLGLSLVGVFFSSILFSLCGLFCAVHTETLNGFMIEVIPFEIIICLPAIIHLFDALVEDYYIIHPGIAAIRLINGNTKLWFLDIISMIFWIVVIYLFCRRAVSKYFSKLGGGIIQ
jgi:fluoroquinolone transport system permease protein